MNEVTRILSAVEQGDAAAAEQLLPLVYDELRRLAARRLAEEKPGQTLQATALVHDAYLALMEPDASRRWSSRRHFFAAAARAMQNLLIDNARRKQAEKHGGGRKRVDFDHVEAVADAQVEDLLALQEALEKLAKNDATAAEFVRLHCFAGLSVEEAGDALGLSRPTAYRQWTFVRAWLRRELAP